MKIIAFMLGLLLGSVSAYAQNPVKQSGSVTKGHAGAWTAQGVLQDAGPWSGGNANVGITDLPVVGTGTPLCIYDAPKTNSLGYHTLCLGANDGDKGTITFNAGGGAAQIPLQICANGQCNDFPFTGGGSNANPDIWMVPGVHPPADSWMNVEIPITGGGAYKYLVPISDFLVQQTHGQAAITGASRSVDSTDTCCTMGGAFVAINDNTAHPQSVWPLYVTGSRLAGTGSIGIEVDIANLDPGPVKHINPYDGGSGMSAAMFLQSGGEPAAPGGPPNYPLSAMLVLNNNGGTTHKGIVFGAGLFDFSYCFQQTCPIIDTPFGTEIRWSYDATDAYGSYIRGLNNTPGSGNGMVLTQFGTVFTNAQGRQLAAVVNAPGMGTGGFVKLSYTSLDGDAMIEAGSNGASSRNLVIGTHENGSIILNAPVQFNTTTLNAPGGTQLFTNSPCINLTAVRWLPVILKDLGVWHIPACQ